MENSIRAHKELERRAQVRAEMASALTAAILGGIGSLPGAALGGMLVALCEAYTAAYVSSEWREVAVFSLLVLVLILRPQGLLGTLPTRPADERLD